MTASYEFDKNLAFDITYVAEGGLLNIDMVPLYQQKLIKRLISAPKTMYKKVMRQIKRRAVLQGGGSSARILPITFGLLNTLKLNCYATKGEEKFEHYFIAIGGMMPFCMLELACYFFNHEEFKPSIGDSKIIPSVRLDGIEAIPFFQIYENNYTVDVSTELSDEEAEILYRSVAMVRGNTKRFDHDTGQLLNAQHYLDQNFTLYEAIMPPCPVRRSYVEYCTEMMCAFLWAHEISHVTNGHFDILNSKKYMFQGRLCQFPENSTTGDEWTNDQARLPENILLALEFDADMDALLTILKIIAYDWDHGIHDNLDLDQHERITLFLFFLFAMFGAIATSEEKYYSSSAARSHPPARLRLINMMLGFSEIPGFKDRYGLISKELFNDIKKFSEYRKYGFLMPINKVSDEEFKKIAEIRNLMISDLINDASIGIAKLRDKWY